MVKKNIKNTIKKHNLINAGEHIVIGLSGGPDSVCLFSVLNELREELGITLHAVHVNHGFRPGAADEDQSYVEQLCAEKGVECTSFIYDCNAIAKAEGLSSEEAGRKARYESFLKVAESLMAQGMPEDKIKIAVAQNADDQAETVLFRLLRGTGTDGLAGIAYRRKEQNIEVIRPLLDTWRKDIEAYCKELDLRPRTDHTNLQPIYTRNKIRLELIPYLQENFNANIMETLGRLRGIASEDSDYLWKCADEAYDRICLGVSVPQGDTAHDSVAPRKKLSAAEETENQRDLTVNATIIFDQHALAGLEPAIRHRVIMKALQELGLTQDITAAHLDAADSILNASGESKTVEFPDGYRMSVRYGEAAFYNVNGLSEYQNVKFDNHTAAPQTAQFDADKIKHFHGDAQPVLRTRRPGDYITIKGGRKKLQDLFVDMKIPKEYRDSVKIIAVGSEILWLPQQPEKGIKKARYSHRCKLDMDTKNCLVLEFDCEI